MLILWQTDKLGSESEESSHQVTKISADPLGSAGVWYRLLSSAPPVVLPTVFPHGDSRCPGYPAATLDPTGGKPGCHYGPPEYSYILKNPQNCAKSAQSAPKGHRKWSPNLRNGLQKTLGRRVLGEWADLHITCAGVCGLHLDPSWRAPFSHI